MTKKLETRHQKLAKIEKLLNRDPAETSKAAKAAATKAMATKKKPTP